MLKKKYITLSTSKMLLDAGINLIDYSDKVVLVNHEEKKKVFIDKKEMHKRKGEVYPMPEQHIVQDYFREKKYINLYAYQTSDFTWRYVFREFDPECKKRYMENSGGIPMEDGTYIDVLEKGIKDVIVYLKEKKYDK